MTRGRDLDWLRSEMDDLFAGLGRPGRREVRRGFRPAADIFRTEDPSEVVVTVDLAGVDPADIELAFADGMLTIAGVRRRPREGTAVYQQMELGYGPFERDVMIGEDVDSAGATAAYDRGILTIRLPVIARAQAPVRVMIAVVREP
jgi:HSP20 family protein